MIQLTGMFEKSWVKKIGIPLYVSYWWDWHFDIDNLCDILCEYFKSDCELYLNFLEFYKFQIVCLGDLNKDESKRKSFTNTDSFWVIWLSQSTNTRSVYWLWCCHGNKFKCLTVKHLWFSLLKNALQIYTSSV